MPPTSPPANRLRSDRHIARVSLLAGVVVAGVVALAAAATSAADTSVATRWEMNEAAGATTMIDAGPFGIDGSIGDTVETGGGRYVWGDVQPNSSPVDPGRLITVPDRPQLNPQGEDFEIEFRYRTNESFGNVIQKGQNATPGGYFKIEQPFGFATCLFKDGAGVQRAVQAATATNDGDWHTIRCELDRSFGDHGRLRILVDGDVSQINTLNQALGTIANDWPVAIGGKSQCDQSAVTCDYFEGELDRVVLRKGGLVSPTSTTTTTTAPSSSGIDRGANGGVVAVRGDRFALD